MMMHRIKDTLQIDEFDVIKNMMGLVDNEWEWMYKYFKNHILDSSDFKVKLHIFKLLHIFLA